MVVVVVVVVVGEDQARCRREISCAAGRIGAGVDFALEVVADSAASRWLLTCPLTGLGRVEGVVAVDGKVSGLRVVVVMRKDRAMRP